jgi:hypothetical protein
MVQRACACLEARSTAAARELEHVSFRPRPSGLRERPVVDFLGFPVAA